MTNAVFQAEPGRHDTVLTALIEAPREEVFGDYIDASLIPQGWGPYEKGICAIRKI